MKSFEFDNSKALDRPNDRSKGGTTVHGAIDLYFDMQKKPGFVSLDIRGPAGAYRGSAIIDKATASKVGAALLKWAEGS